jgi:fatty-acyl-CoA synthase
MIWGDVLGERARLTPDRPALTVVPSGERYTYGELDARARRCVALLDALGLRAGDRVGLLAHNRVEFLDVFFAAGKSGIVVVPLGTRLTAPELEHIVTDSGMRALVYDGALAGVVAALRPRVAVEHWIALDEPLEPRDLRFGPATASATPALLSRPAADDVYCLVYTSGTTGRPKGVMLPHRMLAWNAYNTVASWQLRDDDVSPVFTPLYHAAGPAVFLLPLFLAGGRIVLHASFDPAEVWRTIEQERCTVVLGVPTIFKLLAEAEAFARTRMDSLRWCVSGGAPLPVALVDTYARRGVALKQGYGLTEVGVNCFSMTTEEAATKAGTIGRPMMFTDARLEDETGRPVPDGEVGELLLRGPHVCLGYWNDPKATAAALDDRGFFHTGDLAKRDADGFFTIAGRRKEMFISGGVNVYPAEVEGALLQHPHVEDAAVVGVPEPTWGEVGVAFVVGGRTPPSAAELAAFLGERLAKYKVPKDFVFLASLPRTPYGKVLKGELRETWLRGRS